MHVRKQLEGLHFLSVTLSPVAKTSWDSTNGSMIQDMLPSAPRPTGEDKKPHLLTNLQDRVCRLKQRSTSSTPIQKAGTVRPCPALPLLPSPDPHPFLLTPWFYQVRPTTDTAQGGPTKPMGHSPPSYGYNSPWSHLSSRTGLISPKHVSTLYFSSPDLCKWFAHSHQRSTILLLEEVPGAHRTI